MMEGEDDTGSQGFDHQQAKCKRKFHLETFIYAFVTHRFLFSNVSNHTNKNGT
jgi:hypothetical protein